MQENLATRKEDIVNDRFTKIKNKLIISEIKDFDFRILCYLIARSKNGKCFPSMPTIAKDLKKSRETIRNSLDRLLENKYIEKESRVLGTGKKTSNLYTINEEYLAKKTKQEIFEETQEEVEKEELFDYDWLNDGEVSND